MSALDNGTANMVIDGILGTASFTATTTPLKCRLMTVNGSGGSNGTQVTGGSYAAQTITLTAASAQSTSNSGALNYTGITAGTVVVGAELWDSAGTPKRKAYAALNTAKTVGSDGLLTIAAGGLVFNFA